jgi:prophage antirepressor-like protein
MAAEIVRKEVFQEVELNVIEHEGQEWFTAEDIGKALGFATPRESIMKIFERNKDEFDGLQRVVKLTMRQQDGKIMTRRVTLFSLQAVQKFGFFANTNHAKAFRHWASHILTTGMEKLRARLSELESQDSDPIKFQAQIDRLKKDKANLQSSLSRARKQISEGKQKLLPPPAPEPDSNTRTIHINLLKRLHQCCLSKNPLSAEACRRIVRALLDGKEPPSHDETMKLFKLPFYDWQLENSKTWNLLAALNVPGIDQARAEVQTWALFARYCLMFWEHTYDGFKNLGDQVMTLDRA